MVYRRKDAFHQKAKREGFRSRAAYKLSEFQKSHHLLRPGFRVVDLGCWPGGWLQVAAAAVGPGGRVVGVDRTLVEPPLRIANVFVIQGDLADSGVLAKVCEQLEGPAEFVLSDAAPKLTGIRATDRAHEAELLEAIEAAIPRLLAPGGSLLVKLLECPEAGAFQKRTRSHFQRVGPLKTQATRKGSTERYLLAKGYSG